MADPAATVIPGQEGIELSNGVTLTGIGGDADALREQFEERLEERQPAPKTPATAATEPAKETRGRQRYSDLTRERDDALAKVTAAEARTKELEAQIAAPAKTVTETPRVAAVAAVVDQPTRPKPTESQVGTTYPEYADFVEDLADWKAEQREVKLRRDLAAESVARIEADRSARTVADRVKDVIFPAGRVQYADFDAVLKATSKPVPYPVQEAILKLANPEHAIYVLAKDDAKIDGLVQIMADPLALGIAVAQLMPREPVASPASTAPVVRTTNVSAPIQPVGAGTRTTKPTLQELADAGDTEGYQAARRAGQIH